MSWLKNIQETMFEDIVQRRTNAQYLNNADRLDVYGHGYYVRISSAMAADFPITHWALGEESFSGLVRDFITARPSHEYNINSLGKALTDYAPTHSLAQQFEFLPELIQYEWTLRESQHAERTPSADFATLQSLSVDQWLDARFVFQPNLLVMESQWALERLHQAYSHKLSFTHDLVVTKLSYYIFYQKQDGSYSSTIEKAEYETLILLMKGSSLGDVVETFQEEHEAQSVFGWFQKWQEKELITGVTFESHETE